MGGLVKVFSGDVAPGLLPLGEVEAGFDLGEGDPGGAGDFLVLLVEGAGGGVEASEEEDDGFLDVEAGDVIGDTIAGGGVEDDGEAGFLVDLTEGGFELGFAGLDVAFRETGEAVLLGDEEDSASANDDGAAGFFGGGAGMGMVGADGLGVGEVGNVGGGCSVRIGWLW